MCFLRWYHSSALDLFTEEISPLVKGSFFPPHSAGLALGKCYQRLKSLNPKRQLCSLIHAKPQWCFIFKHSDHIQLMEGHAVPSTRWDNRQVTRQNKVSVIVYMTFELQLSNKVLRNYCKKVCEILQDVFKSMLYDAIPCFTALAHLGQGKFTKLPPLSHVVYQHKTLHLMH